MEGKRVAVVGYGAVGKGLHQLFPNAAVYDEPRGIGSREEVNACDFAFIAVPTPSRGDGSCDTTIVESVVAWIRSPVIIIRSTVAVGTTERLSRSTGKNVVFQPEFGPGETPDHHFNDLRRIRWVILGGQRSITNRVADLYKTVFNADLVIHQTDARTAEMTKYMENCFLALKVTFCNEFYDIARGMNVDYNELRELWLLDPRIGRSHTFVLPDDRGFGGKCLPKDVAAMVHTATETGSRPTLLEAMLRANTAMRAEAKGFGMDMADAQSVRPNGSGAHADARLVPIRTDVD